ncbi:MAG: sugar kinase [Planctomyces sp.]|nr:sugar kinase [Planctomyces sp.]
MPAPRDFDVICAGLIVADHVSAPIPAWPASGGLATTDRIEFTIGGCGANTAVDLARLGVDVALAGRLGRDPAGEVVREMLTTRGVACDLVSASPTAQTATTLVVNVRGEDRRFIHAVGANAEFTGLEIPLDAVARAGVLYIGGFGLNPALSGANVAKLFRAARAAGCVTVLDVVFGDPEPVRGMLAEALPETDVFLPNTDEARQLTGLGDPLLQARHFRELGAATSIVTAGPAGAFVSTSTGGYHLPAYPVEQVDGTGGGDAFVAGYIYGLLQNADLHESLRYGAALGASCVQAMGATTGVLERDQLEAFVASHPLDLTPAG